VRGQTIDALIVISREITGARAFDLNHSRPEVGKMAGREGSGDRMFKADHGHAVER
jgi:hypothetical protein